MTDVLLVVIILLGVGIWFLWESFQFYACHLRSKAHIFLIEGTHPAYQAASYGLGPLGIGVICVGVSLGLPLSQETTRDFLFYGAAPFFVIGFGLTIWQPRWLTPAWLIWLVEYNYDILSLLAQEARQNSTWTQQIRSQVDLETWVAEIRQKHNEPQPLDSLTEAYERAGLEPQTRPIWGVAILIIGVASGLGQLFLGNAFIGFIFGGGVTLVVYQFWSKE
jgi:hypothetical protein